MRKIMQIPMDDPGLELAVKSDQLPSEISITFSRRLILRSGDVLFFGTTPYYLLDKATWEGKTAHIKLSRYPSQLPLEYDLFYFLLKDSLTSCGGTPVKESRRQNCFTSRYQHGKFTYSPWLIYSAYHEDPEYPLEEALQDCVYEFTALDAALNISSPESYDQFFKHVTYPVVFNLDNFMEDIFPDVVFKKIGENTGVLFRYEVMAEKKVTIEKTENGETSIESVETERLEEPYEVLVTWQMLREWGIKTDDIFEIAHKNAEEFIPQYCEAKALSWNYRDTGETPKFAKIKYKEDSPIDDITYGIFLKPVQDTVERSGLAEKGSGWYCVPVCGEDVYVIAKDLVEAYDSKEAFLKEFRIYLEKNEPSTDASVSLELFEYLQDEGLVSRGVLEQEKDEDDDYA